MKGILADTLHAVVVGGRGWIACGDAGDAPVDYRAEAMRCAFEPCSAVSVYRNLARRR